MHGLEFTPTNSSGDIYEHPVFELPNLSYVDGGTDSINVDAPFRLLQLNKQEILTITPAEGTIVNDGTDHVPVIYENGKWYPLQIGSALGSGSINPLN
ncbi:hypothetical protein OQ252_06060 [Acetobacter farinalis]|uniref:Uncharacterized protein n=1 Tax=Acetobacter farinalis TaxID=1260984 RepID=A0ABT3Q6Q6_9PROT|nr:hypothetical protein [Acetobacter farinalis]MCX2560964.1 hypothetical protein [Acetobacter farinalis]NHO29611.1 hypothetical protein [Acetobacter farinalis]